MPIIEPISDLRNYPQVLEKVVAGAPVYLTRNGRGQYSLHAIEDDEEYERAKAMIRLLCEVNQGIRSGEEEDWLTEEDVRAHFRQRRRSLESQAGDRSIRNTSPSIASPTAPWRSPVFSFPGGITCESCFPDHSSLL